MSCECFPLSRNKPETSSTLHTESINHWRSQSVDVSLGFLFEFLARKLSSLHRNTFILCLWFYLSRDFKCIQRIFNGTLIKNETCGRVFFLPAFSLLCCKQSWKKYFSSTITGWSGWRFSLRGIICWTVKQKGHLLDLCVFCTHKIIMRWKQQEENSLTQTFYVRLLRSNFGWQMFPFFQFHSLSFRQPLKEPLNHTTIYSNSKSHSTTLKKCVCLREKRLGENPLER